MVKILVSCFFYIDMGACIKLRDRKYIIDNKEKNDYLF